MTEGSVTVGSDREAPPDSEAFHRFLAWLDAGSDSGGRSYLDMRRRLVAYFDRKNCLDPDELADDTLSRVSRRLAEEGEIDCETPAKYCYIVARFVFLEHLRSRRVKEISLDDPDAAAGRGIAAADTDEAADERERTLACLDKCATELKPGDRDLIVGYYHGQGATKIENRRTLAQRSGITVNALSIRACRIRDKLGACVGRCVGR